MKIIETQTKKQVRSLDYNFNFSKVTGHFQRWGKTLEDDPDMSYIGPEILDIEISEGECEGACPHCYKSNSGVTNTHHMTLDTFKDVLSKFNKNLTQIAFGITDIYANPDFFDIMTYTRSQGIIPNYTCHGLDVDVDVAQRTKTLCGAVAVSIVRKEKSYDAIKKFTDAGMDQVNIHFVLSEQSFDRAKEIVDDIATNTRLEKLNAIVFLQYKPKGRTPNKYQSIQTPEKYKELIEYCNSRGVSYGFDSCSFPLFAKSIEGTSNYEQMVELGEPCESTLFSAYINCHGDFYPCSFLEGEKDWETGISVTGAKSFSDVWHHQRTQTFRNKNIKSSSTCPDTCPSKKYCRSCVAFDITSCK